MAYPAMKVVAPGDPTVASAANRSATGTRASSIQRIEGASGTLAVASRYEWRPAEDHGFGQPGSDESRQRHQPPEPPYVPLAFRFSVGYIANEGDATPGLAFLDMRRGVRLYESTLRLLAANDHEGRATRRGHQINRLY